LRPCTPQSFGNTGGQYHCEHQDYRPAIRFDFSGIPRQQTKKRGDDRLCAAMDDISLVANSSYQLYWEGSCKAAGGCDIYSEQWFIGAAVKTAVAS
jgi:hypothetical protein